MSLFLGFLAINTALQLIFQYPLRALIPILGRFRKSCADVKVSVLTLSIQGCGICGASPAPAIVDENPHKPWRCSDKRACVREAQFGRGLK